MRRRVAVSNVAGMRVNEVPRSALLFAVDGLVGAGMGVLMVLSALSPSREHLVTGPVWFRVFVAVVGASAVAFRRLAPSTLLVVAVTSSSVAWALGFERESFLTVALVLYVVASTRQPRRSGLALAGAVVATVVTYMAFQLPNRMGVSPQWWQWASMAATSAAIESAGWALGVAVYRQRSYVAAVRVQAAQEVRAQRELAARSAAEERLRIARELHDVVTHAMSVITVQAGVARYILPTRPEQTSDALEAIESTGRQALRDMRQLLGVLREDGESSPNGPAPGLSELDDLIEGTRAAGTAVELCVRGEVRPLPEGVELSAYRIVQEALTNVVKHAATDHARVVLAYEPEQLAIEVVDDGVGARAAVGAAASGGGHGLIGMRERAALHGGSLEAGPLPVRGYRVAARLNAPTPLNNPAPPNEPTRSNRPTQQHKAAA